MKIERGHVWKIFAIIVTVFICSCYWETVKLLFVRFIGACTPIVAGFSIAYVLNILMSFFERHYFVKKATLPIVKKTKRPVCLLMAILTFIAIVTVIVMLIVPELVACVRLLVNEIPSTIEKTLNSRFFIEFIPDNILTSLSDIDWQQHIGNLADVVTNGLGNATMAVITALTSVISVVITLFISIVFAVYFLINKENLQRHVKKIATVYIPQEYMKRISRIIKVTDECFRSYIVGQCTEALVLGVLCATGMMLFKFPYAAMISVVVGMTALIPIAGAYIGAGIGAIMIFSISPIKALLFLIFIIVLQQIEGNFIYPKVVGKSVGLPAFYVISAITVGGGIGGIAGMIIGVPITASIYRLISEDVKKREKKLASEIKKNK